MKLKATFYLINFFHCFQIKVIEVWYTPWQSWPKYLLWTIYSSRCLLSVRMYYMESTSNYIKEKYLKQIKNKTWLGLLSVYYYKILQCFWFIQLYSLTIICIKWLDWNLKEKSFWNCCNNEQPMFYF